MIDVTDDAAGFVHGSNAARRVERCMGEEAVARLRKILLSCTGRVKFKQRLVLAHERHHEPDECATSVTHDGKRECNERRLLGKPQSYHRGDFLFARCGVRYRVNLNRSPTAIGQRENLTFTTLADAFAKADQLPIDKELR